MGVVTALQGSFIDGDEDVTIGEVGDGLVRTDLGSGAWFDLRRRWVLGADTLFTRLAPQVPWRTEARWMYDRVVGVPRLVAHYSDGEELPDPLLAEARRALSAYYRDEPGGTLVSAGLCLYRDGRDSVAWHGDRIGRGEHDDVVVAIVSLGASRRMLLRPRGGGASRKVELGRGDLFVMGGSCQRTWDHAVPKAASTSGARISIQFRPADTR